jgi:2-keto-3-deoxy-L-rhamnonate aldolase RhmA
MGPAGIIFPYVRSEEEAKKAISACTYPPKGVRGFGPMRAARYGGMDTQDYMEQVGSSFWKVIQIEHIDAVNDLNGILSVEGVDAIVIGPNDLAASMGYMGKTDYMEVQKQFDTICALAKRAGTPVGISTGYTGNSDDIKKWMDRGVDFIFLGSDMSMLLQGGLEIKNQIQACKK